MIPDLPYGLIAFGLIIVPLVGKNLPAVPQRLNDLRDGIVGAAFVFLQIPVLLVSAYISFELAEIFPILRWSWLGYNFAAAPLVQAAPAASGGAGGSSLPNIASILVFVVGLVVIYLAMLIFAYNEEVHYRDSYSLVAVWAAMHVIMGPPLLVVGPLFLMGLVYKYIYDNIGLNAAYTAHFLTNCILITAAVFGILFAM